MYAQSSITILTFWELALATNPMVCLCQTKTQKQMMNYSSSNCIDNKPSMGQGGCRARSSQLCQASCRTIIADLA